MLRVGYQFRKGFAKGLTPALLKKNVIHCQNICDIIQSTKLQSKLSDEFNEWGIVLVQLHPSNDINDNQQNHNETWLRQQMGELKNIFNKPAFHEKALDNDLLIINPKQPNSVNVKNTCSEHSPHTDGAHYVCYILSSKTNKRKIINFHI